MQLRTRVVVSIVLLILAADLADAEDAAEVIFDHATVRTLDAQGRIAEAVAIRGDKILAVGSSADIGRLATGATKVYDLTGKTIIPGLYAAHDHFPGAGNVVLFKVDLNSPPIGNVHDIVELVAALKQKAAEVPKGKWVVGRGYDDTLLKERRHPTREDLDRVSTEHPIWITHVSGHLGVANSKALEMAKITRDTKAGAGRIRKDPVTGEPNGVFEEVGGLVSRLIPGQPAQNEQRAIEHDVREYASRGVTTTVIASGGAGSIADLRRALASGVLRIRVITMTSGGPAAESRDKIAAMKSPMLKAGAIKLLQDGSIQGFTGFLSEPYFTPFAGRKDYRGYSMRTRAALVEKVKELHRGGYQIAIHANGDAAIADVLYAYAEAQQDSPRPDARHRIEHCQTVREDQLDAIGSLGVTPSFFVGHVYYWGDRHEQLFLGPDRAARISPLASAVGRGIRFTVHDDTPVTPVNPLQLVWASVNRLTTGGKVLGPEQRISVEHALRAVTTDAAWQNFEENTKGTIEPGKMADLVVLDQDPMAVEPGKLRDLRVLRTVVGGQTVFER